MTVPCVLVLSLNRRLLAALGSALGGSARVERGLSPVDPRLAIETGNAPLAAIVLERDGVAEPASFLTLVESARTRSPNVGVFLVSEDGPGGVELGARTRCVRPEETAAAVAEHLASLHARAIEASASPWLYQAISALGDRHRLTAAERLVAEQVVRGLSNKEIGSALGTRAATVRTHLANLSRKLRVESRSELAYRVFCESHAARVAYRIRPGPARTRRSDAPRRRARPV
jgi:DNA-binding CsgD family transcriptional regulator